LDQRLNAGTRRSSLADGALLLRALWRPGSLSRHSLLNLLGAATPAVIGLALLPAITRGLGFERYGLLALALAVLEFGSLFSLGLGPATTKYLAESIARGDGEARRLVALSVGAQISLGLVGGTVIALVAGLLATQVFTVPTALQTEAADVFQVVGLLLPVTLVFGTLLGALEGARHFGYSNLLRVPVSAATFIVPVVMLRHTTSVPLIILVLAIVRSVFAFIAALIVRAVLAPAGSLPVQAVSAATGIRRLVSFGAWVSASSILSTVLVYGERLMLGAGVGVRATGLYAAPLDGLLRVLLLPGSVVRALLPLVSGEHAKANMLVLRSVFARATAALIFLMAPPLLLVAAFAPQLLGLWLGPEYAAAAGMATRLLALGVLANALAQVPASFLLAVGRPDIPTKLHVAEVVAYVPLAWWLIVTFGITGAAIAWAARAAVDAALLFIATRRLLATLARDTLPQRAPRPLPT
jgi:O-antigen/teichoic acid export membrane protein